MEVQFDVYGHHVTRMMAEEIVADNILSNAKHGVKTQCVYFNTRRDSGVRICLGNDYYEPILDFLNEKGAMLVTLGDKGLFRIGKNATVKFVREFGIKPRVFQKCDAVHWLMTQNIVPKMLRNEIARTHFYGNYIEEAVRNRMKSWKSNFSLRFIYHAPSINNETENEGDISICRQCEYCGKSRYNIETSNRYVFDNLKYTEEVIQKFWNDSTREEVVEGYKAFVSEPEEPGVLRDFFMDRTEDCGVRYLSGERGKDLKEVVYVRKGECPYATEHLMTFISKNNKENK